jgi:hypothetical protein
MTDTNALLPNAQAVPTEMGYGLKPSMVASRSYYTVVSPQSNSTNIQPGSTITHRIPCGRKNTFLDPSQSFMKITVKNNDGYASLFDGCAVSLINRMDCYHAGNLLDQVLNYNRVANYLLNNTLTASQRANLSTSMGFAADGSKLGLSLAQNAVFTATLPMLGALFLGSDRMIPVGLLSDDIEVQFLLETTANAFYNAGAAAPTDYSVSCFELHLAYVEISDAAMAEVASTFGQQVYIASNTYRVAPLSLDANAAGAVTTLVPARYSSLKSLHFLPSPASYQVYNAYSLGGTVSPNIASVQIRVGQATVPNRPIQLIAPGIVAGFAEAYMSIQRALHAVSSTDCEGVYTVEGFNVAQAPVANTPITAIPAITASSVPSFAFAQELESVAHKSSVLVAGMNTLSTPLFLDLTISAAPTQAYTIYSIHHIDTILVIENGIMTVRI